MCPHTPQEKCLCDVTSQAKTLQRGVERTKFYAPLSFYGTGQQRKVSHLKEKSHDGHADSSENVD